MLSRSKNFESIAFHSKFQEAIPRLYDGQFVSIFLDTVLQRQGNELGQHACWLMGTLQPLDDKEPVRFGITREVNTSSFWDVHFGEFRLLWNDVCSAGSVRGVFGYLFCAPGW